MGTDPDAGVISSGSWSSDGTSLVHAMRAWQFYLRAAEDVLAAGYRK
jgi:hypothetical protein